MSDCGVYKITNIINNKYYIGSAKDLKSRKRVHFYLLRKDKHHSIHLQRSCNKYGIDNFKFEVIEHCDNTLEREQYYIDTLNPSYNINLKATNRQDTPNLSRRKLNNEQVLKAFKLKQERYTSKNIAKIFNYDASSLSRIFSGKHYRELTKDLELNHKLIPHKSKMRLKEQDIEIIVNRLKKGYTQKSIANDMNIDQSTVSLIKKRRNCV